VTRESGDVLLGSQKTIQRRFSQSKRLIPASRGVAEFNDHFRHHSTFFNIVSRASAKLAI